MSVPVGKRSKSKLEVHVKAIDLARYTLQICSNEKYFPKRDRWIVTNKIVDLAVNIVRDIAMANNIRVSVKSDFELRRKLQTSALTDTYGLLTLIDLAYYKYQMRNKRVQHWTGLVIELQGLIRPWRNSDLQRYKHLLEE